METVNTVNEEKKQNWFERKIEWWKEQNKAHPVKTKVLTGLAGAGVLTLVGGTVYLIYKACSTTGAEDNVDYLMDGLAGIEPDHVNLPASLGFDCVKVVNEDGDILIESLTDMGSDYMVAGALNLPNIAHQIETMDVNDLVQGDIEAIQLATAKAMESLEEALKNI